MNDVWSDSEIIADPIQSMDAFYTLNARVNCCAALPSVLSGGIVAKPWVEKRTWLVHHGYARQSKRRSDNAALN
jgi:hypothetical protein